jgi:hypothetical protein
MINLISGGQVDENNLTFEPKTYHVFDSFSGEDLTYEIRQRDKAQFIPDFSKEVDNERAFAEAYKKKNGSTPPPVGSTSTFVNFWNQITTDPLQAPIAVALGQGASGRGLGIGTTQKVIKGLVVVGGILLVLYGINTLTNAAKTLKN